jgi:RNA polymerase sigma factor (sigma-70 family)
VSLVDVPEPPLTPREKEILRLMAQGYTYRQIADTLGISPRVARTHVERIRKKLDP